MTYELTLPMRNQELVRLIAIDVYSAVRPFHNRSSQLC